VFKADADLDAEVRGIGNLKAAVGKRFENAFKGVTVRLNEKQLAGLSNNPNILIIEKDSPVALVEPLAVSTQANAPWGLDRIDQLTGIDSTYKAYKFVLVNMHPATDDTNFLFNLSTDGGSNYNATKTTTVFETEHAESDTSTALGYNTAVDLAQSTSFQPMAGRVGNGNDEHYSGTLFLFNPSSTTYVKHFIGDGINYKSTNTTQSFYIAGYANTASAVNAIQFKFASGNIDAGTIYMYGIKG
jgi:hypothetical protein